MKKLLLTLLLAVVSSSAMAEWVEVGSNDYYYGFFEFTAYADPASIRKMGDIVKMRILMHYKPVEIVEMVDGKQQKFVIETPESVDSRHGVFNCKNTQSRAADSYEWVPAPPDSMEEGLWKIACGK